MRAPSRAGREGVAELVARALSEGTAARDAYRFAVAGERLGATWRASTDWDSLRCGFEVPVGELAAATELLAEAVRESAFDDDTLTRVRDERIDEISIELSQPTTRASEAFAAEVFADASRYHRSDGGDVASLEATTHDDIRSYRGSAARPVLDHADRGRRPRAASTSMRSAARSSTAGPTHDVAAPAPDVTAAAVRPPRGRRGSARIGAVDAATSATTGRARKIDDYVAMTTMSLVLGGMFSSRLNLKIREEKGYSYGARSGFDTRKHGGVFVASSAVQSDVTIPALADMVAEIERMHSGGVEPAELEQARAYRAGVFPINFAGGAGGGGRSR